MTSRASSLLLRDAAVNFEAEGFSSTLMARYCLLPAPVLCAFRTVLLLVLGAVSSCDRFDCSRQVPRQALYLCALSLRRSFSFCRLVIQSSIALSEAQSSLPFVVPSSSKYRPSSLLCGTSPICNEMSYPLECIHTNVAWVFLSAAELWPYHFRHAGRWFSVLLQSYRLLRWGGFCPCAPCTLAQS
jgi:hypothetical protein